MELHFSRKSARILAQVSGATPNARQDFSASSARASQCSGPVTIPDCALARVQMPRQMNRVLLRQYFLIGLTSILPLSGTVPSGLIRQDPEGARPSSLTLTQRYNSKPACTNSR